jgi:hypothetical protein
MPFTGKMDFNRAEILTYIVAIAFGIIIGSLRTREFQCNKVLISGKSLRGENLLHDTNLRNANDSKQSNTSSMKKYTHSLSISLQHNLVITAAVNSGLEAIYRVARSVRASCPFCTLVMIVSHSQMQDKNLKELTDLYSIVYISYDEYFPVHLKAYQSDIKHVHSTRWLIIHNYLLTLQTKRVIFDNVFVCDSHDSLFQTNVFAYMTDYTPGLYAFIEDVGMTIGKCSTNRMWIKICYDDAEVEHLFNKSISCSGTVLGTWSAMMSYLAVMESQILSTPVACKNNHGSDQGVHNYIIHNRKIPNVTIHHISHEYGFVGTLAHAQWLKRNQFGLVLNTNRSVYAVIHQWNRSHKMIEQLQREYHVIPEEERDRKN